MSRVCEQLKYETSGYKNDLELRELQVEIVHQRQDLKLQVVRIGPATLPHLPNKSVFFVGETGSGKTTLINGCINYLCGVNYDDNFRLKVKDFGNEGKERSASQTDWITVYHLSYMDGMPYHYNYQLIDTPGFNDTNCLGLTTRQLQEFFSTGFGVTELNMIGVVMKATDNRRTENIRGVLREASTCLGSSIDEIKVMLATHAVDGSQTLVDLLTDEKFPYKELIEVDNFPLYRKVDIEKRWKDAHEKYSILFDKLHSTNSISLQYAVQLNEAKKELEKQKNLLKRNMIANAKLIKILTESEGMLQQLVDDGESITWKRLEEREITVMHQVPTGYHVHNCNMCKRTCTSHCKDTHSELALTNFSEGLGKGMFFGMATERASRSPFLGMIAGVTTGLISALENKKCQFFEVGRCSKIGCNHDIRMHEEQNTKIEIRKIKDEVTDRAQKAKYDAILKEQNQLKTTIKKEEK